MDRARGDRSPFAVCRPAKVVATTIANADGQTVTPRRHQRRLRRAGAGQCRRPASEPRAPAGETSRQASHCTTSASRAQRLTGTIVHRLFQHKSIRRPVRAGRSASLAVRDRSRSRTGWTLADWDAVCDSAFERYRRLRDQPDLQALPRCWDVPVRGPVSRWSTTSARMRSCEGSIDCLVMPESGPVTVLEFKTGAPAPGHVTAGRAISGCNSRNSWAKTTLT